MSVPYPVSMEYAESLVELIGNTPLVKLSSVTEGLAPLVLAKVEYLNPGGSVKDRIALRMIEAAERSGELRPGGTIVEPTSGNTGVGLAIVAQTARLQVRLRLPGQGLRGQDQRAPGVRGRGRGLPDGGRRRSTRTPTTTSPTGWSGRSTARGSPTSTPTRPTRSRTTRPPARRSGRQTDGRVTHFVAGLGTGGTISGTGRYLKEVSGGRVRVVGADPEGSVYSGGTGRPYLVEGVGEDFWPTTYDRDDLRRDRWRSATRTPSSMTRRLAREEGLLVGGSCGMAVAAALRVAARRPADDVVVVLLPDGGRGYLSKIFNDDWMADYGFLRTVRATSPSATCCGARPASCPSWCTCTRSETVRRGHRHPPRVRRLADAGGQGRAAGDERRGGRLGGGAGPARRCSSPARPGWPTRWSSTCPRRCR